MALGWCEALAHGSRGEKTVKALHHLSSVEVRFHHDGEFRKRGNIIPVCPSGCIESVDCRHLRGRPLGRRSEKGGQRIVAGCRMNHYPTNIVHGFHVYGACVHHAVDSSLSAFARSSMRWCSVNEGSRERLRGRCKASGVYGPGKFGSAIVGKIPKPGRDWLQGQR